MTSLTMSDSTPRRTVSRIIITLVSGYLAITPLIAAAQVSPIAETIHSLQAIPLEDDLSTVVPLAARPLLAKLKHQLRDLALDTINATPHRLDSPEQLRSAIVARLKQRGITIGDQSKHTGYGAIMGINIQRPAKHKDLLALTITLGIACGEDTSLYILKYRQNRWDLALALEANHYAEINGAQGSFQYAISPPDLPNEFFIVAVDINPWCTSCWQSIRYKVLKIGSQAYEPSVLLTQKAPVYRCDEDGRVRLTVTTQGFLLTFIGSNNRPQVEKYMVEGEKVTRAPDR